MNNLAEVMHSLNYERLRSIASQEDVSEHSPLWSDYPMAGAITRLTDNVTPLNAGDILVWDLNEPRVRIFRKFEGHPQ